MTKKDGGSLKGCDSFSLGLAAGFNTRYSQSLIRSATTIEATEVAISYNLKGPGKTSLS